MTIQHRAMRGVEIRAAQVDGKPGVTLHCIKPGVVDDYGSLWNPHAFDESLEQRLPTLCWAHDWSEPLGPALDFELSDDGPQVRFVFSDFEAVPQARRAHAQVLDGTIQDCSVGFWNVQRRDPTDDEREQYPGITEVIEKAELDEVSLVLRGAVPGAKVLAVRSPKVAVEAALDLARRVSEGEITQDEAKAALDLLAKDDPAPTAEPPAEELPDPEAVEAEQEQVLADLGAVLADRSRR
jgi:HK97 family phage prohead protease